MDAESPLKLNRTGGANEPNRTGGANEPNQTGGGEEEGGVEGEGDVEGEGGVEGVVDDLEELAEAGLAAALA